MSTPSPAVQRLIRLLAKAAVRQKLRQQPIAPQNPPKVRDQN
jgi:hypothetical protein